MRTRIDTPIGPLTLLADQRGALYAVRFASEPGHGGGRDDRDPTRLDAARDAFRRYFEGEPNAFAGLPLSFGGTRFQRAVWQELIELPFGTTTTYARLAVAIAQRLGVDSTSPRAVGAANARTPIPIVMACHRVVGSDGSLTGYRGGLRVKRALLAFEASGGDLTALCRGLLSDRLAAVTCI